MQFSQSLLVAAVLGVLLTGGQALAQDASVSGPGYRVSEATVLHPSLGAETGYVSNVFYEQSAPISAPVFRLRGSLAFASLDLDDYDDPANQTGAQPTFDFSAGARATYEEYLTGEDTVRAQRNLGLGADVKLIIFPKGKISLSLTDNFIRTNRPTNFESNLVLNRNINHARAKLTIGSSESTITGSLRLENTIDFFESSGSSFANRQLSLIGTRVNWQFLPITRLYFDGSYGFNSSIGDGTSVSSTPLRLIVGADTAITEATTFRMHGGFVKGFYSSGSDYTNAAYGAEFGFRYSPVGRLILGYDHDFRDSINGNYYSDHALELKVDQQIARVLVTAKGRTAFRNYQNISMNIGPSSRDDFILSVGLDASYEMKEWLALSANYLTDIVSTDYRSMLGGRMDDPSYTRNAIMIGATANL